MCIINSQALIQPNETPKAYRIRLYKNKELYGLNNVEIGKLCNEAFGVEWDESAHRKKTQNYLKGYNDAKSELGSTEQQLQNMIEENRQLKLEAQKELVKVQTEKLEYNKWVREDARDELFEAKVIESIKKYGNISNPPDDIPVTHSKRNGLLCIADCHFGKEYTIYGLFDEVINQYSPEIFYDRMTQIYNETLEMIEREKLSTLYIFNLGDSVEGFIRHSQLWSLRWGVIDSATMFGNYMGDWLRKLSEKVNIVYHQTDGNHDELRLLDGKKGQHLCESAGKIVKNCIELKNENNPNFTYKSNKTGLILENISGYNVMGIHGEVNNLSSAIKDYSDIYDLKVSYLCAGHKHHSEFVNCGVKKGCIGVGSVVGSDDFSMTIRKAADATASFIVFEEGKGKTDEHTYVLN